MEDSLEFTSAREDPPNLLPQSGRMLQGSRHVRTVSSGCMTLYTVNTRAKDMGRTDKNQGFVWPKTNR